MPICCTVKLGDNVGLHGRPGALLVDLARRNSETRIVLKNGGKEAIAASLLALLALGVGKGGEVVVEISGGKEEAIFDRVLAILLGEVR